MSVNLFARRAWTCDAGDALVEAIQSRWPEARTRSGVMGGIGVSAPCSIPKAAGFRDPVLVSSTDGVGTQAEDRHSTPACTTPSASTSSPCASTT